MKRSLRIAVALVGLAAMRAAGGSILLGEYNDHSFWGIRGVFTEAQVTTYLSPDFGSLVGEGVLWEGITVESGVTRMDTATFGDDPDFQRYVELLTDGLDWYLYDRMIFSPQDTIAPFSFESIRLPIGDDWGGGGGGDDSFRALPDEGTPDLIGKTIHYVQRTVTLTLTSPGSDPNGDGFWTDIEFQTLTQIYGTPEPTSGMCALLAAAAVLRRRRRG
jgi:uncharacterized protein (TIGR03382 family)